MEKIPRKEYYLMCKINKIFKKNEINIFFYKKFKRKRELLQNKVNKLIKII